MLPRPSPVDFPILITFRRTIGLVVATYRPDFYVCLKDSKIGL